MNKLKINIISSIFLQTVTIISGFIIPKIILLNFGSNVNGLISSINQFLNYVTLLEGGIGSVIMAILYKPLRDSNAKRVSQIVNTTLYFFKKLSYVYITYVIFFSIVYPLFVNTGFNFWYSVLLIWVLALNLFFQYFLSISYRLLLNADRKIFYVSFVQALALILNFISVLIFINFIKNIIVIKTITALVFLIQPIAYYIYTKKHYLIRREDGTDKETLNHRWDGFGINLAFFIHSNTDIAILTAFASLADVSVYTVYLLIVKALKSMVSSISSAILPSFGNVLASGNKKESNVAFNRYEFGIGVITTFIFTCGMILITPFVDVYTIGVLDANYHKQLFGILIVFSEMVYCYRDPYVSTAYAAGHIKQLTKFAYVEALLNIVISLFLVKKLGLIGIAVGTIIAMIYRTAMQVYYLKNNILYRPIRLFAKNLNVNIICMVLPMIICYRLLNLNVNSYFEWFILAIKVGLIVLVFTIFIYVIFLKDDLLAFFNKEGRE